MKTSRLTTLALLVFGGSAAMARPLTDTKFAKARKIFEQASRVDYNLNESQQKEAAKLLDQAEQNVPKMMERLLQKRAETSPKNNDASQCKCDSDNEAMKMLVVMVHNAHIRCRLELNALKENITIAEAAEGRISAFSEVDPTILCARTRYPTHTCISERNLGYMDISMYPPMAGNTAFVFYEVKILTRTRAFRNVTNAQFY